MRLTGQANQAVHRKLFSEHVLEQRKFNTSGRWALFQLYDFRKKSQLQTNTLYCNNRLFYTKEYYNKRIHNLRALNYRRQIHIHVVITFDNGLNIEKATDLNNVTFTWMNCRCAREFWTHVHWCSRILDSVLALWHILYNTVQSPAAMNGNRIMGKHAVW